MKRKYTISVLGGDGTGPEVVEQSIKVVLSTQNNFDIDVSFRKNNIGGNRYLKTGELVTKEDIEEFLYNQFSSLVGEIYFCSRLVQN